MLIKEVAERTGFTRDTIRYYEKIGLIRIPKKQRRQNNYKEYSEEVIQRLEIIKRARHLGFTLSEIATFMDAWLHKTFSKTERIDLFESRIKMINEKIFKLKEIRTYLAQRINEVRNEK